MGVEELWEPGHNNGRDFTILGAWRYEGKKRLLSLSLKCLVGQWNLISFDFVAGEDIYTPKAKHWRHLTFK